MRFKQYIQQHPVSSYFATTFIISWLGAFAVVAAHVLHHEPLTKFDGLLMFPAMIIGPCAASIILTRVIDGRVGLRNLWSRSTNWKVSIGWYVFGLFVFPCVTILVLLILRNLSAAFRPNFFPLGILFSIPAGLLEEIGWTGFALPRLISSRSVAAAGATVGLLWGLWHFPVIDFLGAATPHGDYLFPFFFSFVCLLAAARVLMAWVYSYTQSIVIVQVMHISLTGSLVMIGPSHTSPAQETLWYAVYAGLLSFCAFFIVRGKVSMTPKR
jgi:membrane protease YdiL (CAAX protease family)